MITGARAMVKCLENHDVTTIYGYPGATICPFYDALIDSHLHHVLVRTEQNAAHAASGYARSSGKVGVCVATSGPGATNLLTGIASAYLDSIPLVVITGQVHSSLLGRDVFQEADITGAAEPFTKHSYLVKNAEDIPKIFTEAFHIASTGRPGPVLIDIPIDMQTTKINDATENIVIDIIGYKPQTQGHVLQIKRALKSLEKSKKPLICIGGGAFSSNSDAYKEIRTFVDKTNIPAVVTMMGIGALKSTHPLNMGMIGTHGVVPANKALNDADLIILAGSRIGDRSVSRPENVASHATIIHIDIDPAEIGKNIAAQIPIVGDLALVFREFNRLVEYNAPSDWVSEVCDRKKRHNDKISKDIDGFINPRKFMKMLSKKADSNCTVVADVGQNQIWTSNYFTVTDGRFLTSGGMGTMGYSVPCAVGAKMAAPEKQVFAICGDGSFQMSMPELATICQESLDIKIIVFKNSRLGMVRELQYNNYKKRYSGVFLDGSPDFVKIAAAYGISSASISSNDEAESAVDTMINHKGAYVLECCVSPDDMSY